MPLSVAIPLAFATGDPLVPYGRGPGGVMQPLVM
jgi:hypothetical protein